MSTYLTIDVAKEEIPRMHGLLLGAITPRPIAFASTIDKAGKVYTASIARNGGLAPLDVHAPVEELPDEFKILNVSKPFSMDEWRALNFKEGVKVSIEVNKPAIRAVLEAGQSLPFATLMDRGVRLNVR